MRYILEDTNLARESSNPHDQTKINHPGCISHQVWLPRLLEPPSGFPWYHSHHLFSSQGCRQTETPSSTDERWQVSWFDASRTSHPFRIGHPGILQGILGWTCNLWTLSWILFCCLRTIQENVLSSLPSPRRADSVFGGNGSVFKLNSSWIGIIY